MGPVLNPVTGIFRGREGGVMTETGIIAMWPRAQERLPGAPEAARGTEASFPRAFGGSEALPTPSFRLQASRSEGGREFLSDANEPVMLCDGGARNLVLVPEMLLIWKEG